MKLIASLFFSSLIIAQSSAMAQHKHVAPTGTHPTTRSSSTPHGCISVGDISSQVPALATGSCPKAFYTLKTLPTVQLDYASPLVNRTGLNDTFPLAGTTVTLAYSDIKIGAGAVAAPGKYFSILYTGYLADGTVFDASSKHDNEPMVIQYGKHNVIPGMDTGMDGMRVGGKRRLYIPYQLAYGANGQPPVIPARAELIFDVEFVSQSDARPAPKPVAATPAQPPSTKPDTAPHAGTTPSAAPKP
jgi:peptidylprolyl isomerase